MTSRVGKLRRSGHSASAGQGGYSRHRAYVRFLMPALIVIFAVIVFPWLYTIWMSLHDWQMGMERTFTGLANYRMLATDTRFLETIPRTLYFTVLGVVLPVILGVFAAEVFHQRFPLRGFLRSVYILPMMTTPVAIALIFIMMYHPQLGILNYLLSLVGIPPQLWIYDKNTVIPALVLVETWQWTPLVMLIVLGGLAALPVEPYESALIDGATRWDMFRYITLPLIMPFLMVAIIIRAIDALKSFDIIFVMTQGGPGTASETINIYLYLQAFSFFNIGHASAVVVVFFVIIVLMAVVLLTARERMRWTK
ncbi:MAG: carbohydrate ABC transporter permease [Caldilineaceae bacterium]|jgi:multiple sugar transport system permease protein